MSLQRIGVIGDVHAEDKRLAAALEFLQAAHLDALLCVGDIVTGRGDVNRCCQLLQEAGVATVRGNHDRWFLAGTMSDLPEATSEDELNADSRAFLASLPPTRVYETVRGCLLLCHGLGDDDMAGVRPGDYGYALEANHKLHALWGSREFRFVVNGHTHYRMARTFYHLTIINAGTLRRGHDSCFLAIDFQDAVAQFYNVDDGVIVPSDIIEFVEEGRVKLT